jgi:hypothetical protein
MKDAGEAFRESLMGFISTWAILEAIFFLALPRVLEIPFEEISGWLAPTVLGGIVGSIIAAFSGSRLTASSNVIQRGSQVRNRRLFGLLGAIGFIGVVFPLLLAGYYFIQIVSTTDWENRFNDQPVLDQLSQ